MSLSEFSLHIVVDKPQTAVAALHASCDLSKGQIKDAMQKGAVWLRRQGRRQRLRRAKRELFAGDELIFHYNAAVLKQTPASPQLLHDAESYSLWYKPDGLMSSGSRYADHHSIVRQVEIALDRPAMIVHRLDRFTRGIMLLAHNKMSAAALARQFRDHTVEKLYQAEVIGHVDQMYTIERDVDGKTALSHVRPLHVSDQRTIVEVRIETGRKHQIRKHMAAIGHPIVGDRQSGQNSGDLQLVAVKLSFISPEDDTPVECILSRELRLI